MKMKLFAALASTLLMSSLSLSAANAQSEYRGGNDRNNNASDFVTIYEHCDYRGDSREVLVGDFKNMRSVNFGNDSVSSVRVPNGMELIIYADDGFRGGSARVSQDIACFDRQWNDQVSSLQVSGYTSERQSNERRNNNGKGDTGNNQDNRARDNSNNNEPNRRINKQCFNYRATSRGGDASVRFQTRESLKRFNNSRVTGRVCHSGSLTMEIGKRDTKTDVVIEIEGQKYRFAPNEQENEYLNSWFRKRIQLSVGR